MKPAISAKLVQRCNLLAQILPRLRPVYRARKVTPTQKDLLETIIGAAIWYLPGCNGLWTGKSSSKALRVYEQCGTFAQLTKEHCYPRKRAGADLLSMKNSTLSGDKVPSLYRKKFGRYNYVTKAENRALIKHQRGKSKFSVSKCYRTAGIELVRHVKTASKTRSSRVVTRRANAQTN